VGGWGVGDGGLGIGDWAQPPIPNPQSPIPNPQSPFFIYNMYFLEIIFTYILLIYNKYKWEILI